MSTTTIIRESENDVFVCSLPNEQDINNEDCSNFEDEQGNLVREAWLDATIDALLEQFQDRDDEEEEEEMFE